MSPLVGLAEESSSNSSLSVGLYDFDRGLRSGRFSGHRVRGPALSTPAGGYQTDHDHKGDDCSRSCHHDQSLVREGGEKLSCHT